VSEPATLVLILAVSAATFALIWYLADIIYWMAQRWREHARYMADNHISSKWLSAFFFWLVYSLILALFLTIGLIIAFAAVQDFIRWLKE